MSSHSDSGEADSADSDSLIVSKGVETFDDMSESIDPALLMRGFDSGDDDALPPVQALDDETLESEDWAERDLRELRHDIHHAPKDPGRRQTINGIDVAPRSELSPPPPTSSPSPPMANVEDLSRSKSGGLRKLRKQQSNTVSGQLSAGDSFFIEHNASSKKGTFSRLGSKLREKKQNKHRKSTSEVFDSKTAGAMNDSLTSSGTIDSGNRSPLPSHSPTRPTDIWDAEGLFRHVLEHALDPDEKVVRDYVFSMPYFTDPVRVLSDLITEHDVAVASKGVVDADQEMEVNVAADRAMKVLSFWVSHVWSQFEDSESLMNILMAFVEANKATRWGGRLVDTIETLVEKRKQLSKQRDAVLAHGAGLASKEDLFSEIDPNDQRLLEETRVVDDAEEGEVDVAEPAEDVTATFVGAETYTEKSRPMGLADLLGDLDADFGSSPSSPSPTHLSPTELDSSSRPMGIFGLLEYSDETDHSIWDLKQQSTNEVRSRSMSIDESGARGTRAADIARHLTMLEFAHWKLVSPGEVRSAAWKTDSEAGLHVRQVISWHNTVASWVQYEVLSRTVVKDRVQAIQRFLTICLHLEALQNFHSLFGVLAGLRVTAVERLHTEQHLETSWRSLYDRLMELGSTHNNWAAYRATKDRATRFPFFPFVGVYLQDLQVVEGREKTFVGDDRRVNWPKMRKLGALLAELVYVQRCEYSFRHIPRVMAYLLSLKQHSDDELWEMSVAIVPAATKDFPSPRPSDKAFLAAALSPRGARSLSSVSGGLSPGHDAVERTRGRSSSIGGRWKPRKDSDPPLSARPSKSGSSSPRYSAISPRSRNGSSASVSSGGSRSGSVSASADTSPRPPMTDCALCGATFGTKQMLVDHLTRRACTGSSLSHHKCPVCEATFKSKDELVPHLSVRKCSPRPQSSSHMCPVCDMVFTQIGDLRSHLHDRTCMK